MAEFKPSMKGVLNMENIIEWKVIAGGQAQEAYYPENYTYEDVKKDLIQNCGFPENVQIRKVG